MCAYFFSFNCYNKPASHRSQTMKTKKYIYLIGLVPFLTVAFMYEIIPLIKIVINSFLPDTGGSFTFEN